MPISVSNQTQDITNVIYDAFYDFQIEPPAGQYEIVNSFFNKFTNDQQTSEAFTVNLFRIATLTGVNVLTLLESFKSTTSTMQINLTMAYYLNSINDNKAIMFGYNNVLSPVQSVQRNVVQ
jgi:hypothetical protein